LFAELYHNAQYRILGKPVSGKFHTIFRKIIPCAGVGCPACNKEDIETFERYFYNVLVPLRDETHFFDEDEKTLKKRIK
jgi:hypothetical protein